MHLPVKVPNLPPTLESVGRAVSAENLRSVATASTEPLVLLGLCFLASSGDPVRHELADLAIRRNSDYARITALLSLMLDRVDWDSARELIAKDPENAIGHYVLGTLLHVSNQADEAMEEFRRATGCAEMRFYGPTLGEALFKAVGSLGLQGADRLCALSWATARWIDFSTFGIQPIYGAISELARAAAAPRRLELADTLLALAGHLFVTSFTNRWFSLRAVENAFVLRAAFEGEVNRAMRNGYAAAFYGLTSQMVSFPGIKEWWHRSPQQLAQFLPARIHQALAAEEANPVDLRATEATGLNDEERAALTAAREKATQAAAKLVEVALSDPDTILGPYFKEPQAAEPRPGGGAAFEWTAVDGLLNRRPDLFQAAAANEEAMAALWKAGENAPSRRNAGRMLEIAWALCGYAQKHEQVFPPNLDALFKHGDPKAPLEPKSLRTGRPYVYVAGTQKMPTKRNDQTQFVLLYDDEAQAGGWYECVFASCTCGGIREADLRAQLQTREKQAG